MIQSQRSGKGLIAVAFYDSSEEKRFLSMQLFDLANSQIPTGELPAESGYRKAFWLNSTNDMIPPVRFCRQHGRRIKKKRLDFYLQYFIAKSRYPERNTCFLYRQYFFSRVSLLRQISVGRIVQHRAVRGKSGAVAGAVPALLRFIPAKRTAHVGTGLF